MSFRNILTKIVRNVISRNVSSTQEPKLPIRHEMKVRKCPCGGNKESIIENATVHENVRRKHRKLKKNIEGVLKEMENKKSFPGVAKE